MFVQYWKEIGLVVLSLTVMVLTSFLYKKPKEIIKTQIVTKEVETKKDVATNVVQKNNIVTKKVTYETDKSGVKKKIIETTADISTTASKTQEKIHVKELDKSITKEITRNESNYIVGFSYTAPILDFKISEESLVNPSNYTILLGRRILGPAFVTTSTTADFKYISLGVLVEF